MAAIQHHHHVCFIPGPPCVLTHNLACPSPSQAVIKPQYVDHIPKAVRGNVGEMLALKDERGITEMLLQELDLQQVGWWQMTGG